jgi:hypothetical protein
VGYNAKLNWKYGDTPTENDANRWEAGILNNDLQITNLITRVQILEDALFSDIAHNKFEEDLSTVDDVIVTKGWYDQTNQRLVGPSNIILDGFGGAYE